MRPSRAVTSASCRYASGGTGSFATAWRSARSAAGRSPASNHARPSSARCRSSHPNRLAACCKRFDRLIERDAIAAALRFGQPHVAERRVDLRRVRETLDGAAQRDHRGVLAPGARLREADGHDAIGARRLERGERFELIDRPGRNRRPADRRRPALLGADVWLAGERRAASSSDFRAPAMLSRSRWTRPST